MLPLTLRPMQRIVPTSFCARGLSSLSTTSFFPVFSPGFRIELPENTSTSIVSPA